MKARRPVPRAIFVAAVAILFAIGAIAAWFQSWKAGRIVELNAASEVADLPSGKMEYSLHGEGVPVVVFHDAPGGFDQGVALAGFLTGEGFEIVSPSRPGYLRTPLASGPSPLEQADAISWLLEELEVDRVAVLAFGHGGPAALEFARKYSQRIHALVLVSAVTARPAPGAATPFPLAVLRALKNDPRSCLFAESARLFPGRALSSAAPILAPTAESGWSQSILQSPSQLDDFQQLALAMSPIVPRETGAANDIIQAESLNPPPTAELRTPTLVVHGALDRFVSEDTTRKLAGSIPDAELLIIPAGGHLPILGPDGDQVRSKILTFLKTHTATGEPTEVVE